MRKGNGASDFGILSFLPHEPNSPFPRKYHYKVETWCCFKREMVILVLESEKEFKGNLVKGKPIECGLKDCDGKLKHPHCYLNAIQIETRKRLR